MFWAGGFMSKRTAWYRNDNSKGLFSYTKDYNYLLFFILMIQYRLKSCSGIVATEDI